MRRRDEGGEGKAEESAETGAGEVGGVEAARVLRVTREEERGGEAGEEERKKKEQAEDDEPPGVLGGAEEEERKIDGEGGELGEAEAGGD